MRSVLFLLAGSLLAGSTLAADVGALKKEAKGVTMNFAKSLKGELMKGMKSGGPVAALDVCNTKAPVITQQAGDSSGWDVSRTSLKLRNPANAPDAWEKSVLQQFEERKAAGEDVKPMAKAEIVEENGKKVFRFMKAIPTGKPCLACHAAEVSPAVEAKLKALYPQDKARGFKAGDIRGAFSLKKTL